MTNTLTSGATGSVNFFNDGPCQNCNVTINQSTNTALINMALGADNGGGTPSGTGFQFLDLTHNTFSSPIMASNHISVQASWDPILNLILSPNDFNGAYDLFKTSAVLPPITSGQSISVPEYANTPLLGVPPYAFPYYFELAAEDCTTGIALGLGETSSGFYGYLYLADLTQANFTSGSPGSWTAPAQFVFLPEFQGTENQVEDNEIVVAPGSQLALVTGDFFINNFGVVQLPSPATFDGGTPNIVDYVAAILPRTPDYCTWSSGVDPHTATAYVSPNSHKAFGLMANSAPPDYLAVVDMAALLAAPRYNNGSGPNNVCQADQTSGPCSNGAPPVDLLASGIVRYVATGNPTGCGG